MKRAHLLFFLYWIFGCPFARAQFQGAVYRPATDVKVTAYSRDQPMAWSGGLNNPQFAMGDLNNDGLQDLIVFEAGVTIKTFVNTGSAGAPIYEYAPKYELNFPPVRNYLVMADYNCDHIPDLFTQQYTNGFMVYKGYYNVDSQLCFTFYKPLYYYNDSFNGPGNATVNLVDIPAIADVDNDGDLDFLSFDPNGGFFLYYYRNMRAELSLPCDSIVIALKDRCWGKFYQPYWRTQSLNYSCDNSGLHRMGNKVTDGNNSVCVFDYDGDGDYDVLDGNNKFPEMTLLINGKAQNGGLDSMIAQDTTWQSAGKGIFLPTSPSAFNVDIDQDGKKDLLISPHSAGSSENYKCVWFYKNNSTTGNPVWTFESDTMLIDQMIDVGTGSYPMLFDYDKDGKADLFIGSDGYYQNTGDLQSSLAYYQNTSTPGNPSFTLVTKDFLGLFSQGFAGIAPAFGDLDMDGIKDMVIGHTDGTLSLCHNNALSDTAQPIWSLQAGLLHDAANAVINVGKNAAPFIYDLNNDGKPDLIIGSSLGFLQYYENTSTVPGVTSLLFKTAKLGNVQVDKGVNIDNFSTPFIGQVDNTRRDYLLVGSNSGNLYRYDGFQNGNDTGVYTMIDSQYSFIDSNLLSFKRINDGVYNNLRVAPTIADIDGDNRYEMIVGNILGGVKIYRQENNVKVSGPPSAPARTVVTAYPNPAREVINLSWSSSFGNTQLQITLFDVTGQKVLESNMVASLGHTQLSVSSLPPGSYYCVVQSSEGRSATPIIILR